MLESKLKVKRRPWLTLAHSNPCPLIGSKFASHHSSWVVRTRPDVAVPCLLSESVLFRWPGKVLYYMDFLAVFPRAAAEAVLREVPYARTHNVTDCFSYSNEHAMGTCNAAVARHAGWATSGISAAVWVPEEERFLEQDVAYPTREAPRQRMGNSHAGIASRLGTMVPPKRSSTTSHPEPADHSDEEPRLFPHLPFGDVSSQSNPLTPNGALYPRCTLAQNATSARAQQAFAGPVTARGARPLVVPFLIGPGEPKPFD